MSAANARVRGGCTVARAGCNCKGERDPRGGAGAGVGTGGAAADGSTCVGSADGVPEDERQVEDGAGAGEDTGAGTSAGTGAGTGGAAADGCAGAAPADDIAVEGLFGRPKKAKPDLAAQVAQLRELGFAACSLRFAAAAARAGANARPPPLQPVAVSDESC